MKHRELSSLVRGVVRVLAAITMSLAARASLPAAPIAHEISRIEFPSEPGGHWTEDVDGDGRADLLVAVHDAERGREILVYLQSASGRFPPTPSSRIEIKRDIIAFDVADLRDEPGRELLLWTASGCFSYSTRLPGYAGNAKRVLRHDLIAGVPDSKSLARARFARDLDGDGRVEILAPGEDAWTIHRAEEDGVYTAAARLETGISLDRDPESRRGRPGRRARRREGLSIGIEATRTSAAGVYEGFVVDLRGSADRDAAESSLVEHERWLAAVVVADVNGDARGDLLSYSTRSGGADSARGAGVAVRRQRADGTFPSAADQVHELADGGGGTILAVDLDGDGRADLLSREGRGEKNPGLRLFRNRGPAGFPVSPDQILRVSGYAGEPRVLDLDGDGRPELILTSFDIPLTGALQGGRVERSLLIYRADPGDERLFGSRPAARLDESFSASEFRGLGQEIEIGRGLESARGSVAWRVRRDGRVTAHRLGTDLAIEDEPVFEHLPPRWVLGLRLRDLDGDGRDDVLLRHHRSLTLIVFSP